MTMSGYMQVIRERWLPITLSIFIGLASGSAAYFLSPIQYSAHITLYVSSQTGDNASSAFQGAQLSQERVKSYTELVTNTRVASEVISRMGLNATPQEVASRIIATSLPDSVLLDITVTDTNATQSAKLANTVGSVFTDLVDELEKPITPNSVAPVAVRVVAPAAIPTQPTSVSLVGALTGGLLAGILVGMVIALIRNNYDTSLRSEEQLQDAAHAPILGSIERDPQSGTQPLAVHGNPRSLVSEKYRQIRTNLQFIDVDRPPRVMLVTSALSGEGKTTTVANLASALASTGGRVLAIEADLRRPKLADLLGLERAIGLTSVLTGRVRFEQAVQSWSAGQFDFLASGQLPPNPSELLGSNNMKRLLDELRDAYEYILIDTPPVLPVTDAATLASATDGVILVARFKVVQESQVRAAADSLKSVSARLLGTVFTAVGRVGGMSKSSYHAYYAIEEDSERKSGAASRPYVTPERRGAESPDGRHR